MAKHDLTTVGINGGARPYRVAASVTRFFAGEPMMRTPTYSSGATNANNIVVLTDAKPRVATDNFMGIAARDAQVNTSGTVIAQATQVVLPIPYVTRIRGKAKVAANVDTDAELLLILGDLVDFDLTSSTYTIDDTAASNASGLEIVDGDTSKQTLDVIVDARAMRTVIS